MTNEIKVEGNTTVEDVNKEAATEAVESTETTESKEAERQEETPEARKARIEGSFKRYAKDLNEMGIDPSSILNPQKPKLDKPAKKSSDLDYGEKAFLISNGIKVEEMDFVQGLIKKTGMSLDEFVIDDFAQAKLKGFRETKTAEKAIPSGTKRSSGNTLDSVEYNLERYENGSVQLKDMKFEMRSKVLAAKTEKDRKASQFSFTPSV